jgi:hypothetical protein
VPALRASVVAEITQDAAALREVQFAILESTAADLAG